MEGLSAATCITRSLVPSLRDFEVAWWHGRAFLAMRALSHGCWTHRPPRVRPELRAHGVGVPRSGCEPRYCLTRAPRGRVGPQSACALHMTAPADTPPRRW